MKNKKIIYFAAALIIGVPALFFALLYTPKSSSGSDIKVSSADLAKHDGINGNECWVAVDGTVYMISGFSQWQMGKHLPSEGKATCGRDLSGVIGDSPHGKSVLSLLRVVGQLQD